MPTVEDSPAFFLFAPNKDWCEPIWVQKLATILRGCLYEQRGLFVLMDNARSGIDGVMCAVMGNALICAVFTSQGASTLRLIAHETLRHKRPGDDYTIRKDRLTRDEKYAFLYQGTSKDERAGLCKFISRWTRGTDIEVVMEGLDTLTMGVLDSDGVWAEYVGHPHNRPTGELMPGVPECMSRADYLHYCYWGYRKLRGARAAGRSMFDQCFAVVEGVRTKGGPKEWAARDAEAFCALFGIVPTEGAPQEPPKFLAFFSSRG